MKLLKLMKSTFGLNIDGNSLDDIKNTLEKVDIGIGAGAYVFVSGEPVTIYKIIYEELSEYGYVK